MNYSENLQLNMPEPAEQFNLEHWNENTQKLDETIHNEIQTRSHESEQFRLELQTEKQARENGDADAKNLDNATNVLSIEHGGTGKNTVNEALDNLFSQLQSQTDNKDVDEFIFKTDDNIKGVPLSNLANSIYNLIASKVGATIPVGIIYPFSGSNDKVPNGYFLCDGREVSRTEYSALFNVIGTSFGNGDEINTFNLPDLRGRFLEGADGNLGNRIEAGLPNITGTVSSNQDLFPSGAFEMISMHHKNSGAEAYASNVCFNASKGETKTDGTIKTETEHHVYGASNTVQPPAVCVNYIIKY